jgi:hypothetical protein
MPALDPYPAGPSTAREDEQPSLRRLASLLLDTPFSVEKEREEQTRRGEGQ